MAYDTHLDLKVAIKVIASSVMENLETSEYEVALKRFQAEARIVARVDHPNVIRVFGFKQDTIEDDGKSRIIDYVIMELMAERTLRDTMDESGFEFEEEVKIWISKYLISILEGLEEVHKSGIVHRDIKPENIFMKENVAKLADFGLSMGVDFPSVTGSMVDVLGTLAYMAPEQYNNFSLARESSDIFAIGRILYEVVEGKITEKITPFTQVQLTNPSTEYYRALSDIIMEATAENPIKRIGSISSLKERLLKLHESPLNVSLKTKGEREPKWKPNLTSIIFGAVLVVLVVFEINLYVKENKTGVFEPQQQQEIHQGLPHNTATVGTVDNRLKDSINSSEESVLLLIPPIKIELEPESPFGEKQITLNSFYLSENPITNEQYVNFLNSNLDRTEHTENGVYFDDRLVLKLSEKIRGYKPIVFDGTRYDVDRPMHSSCAVLMVTGYGAEAYAHHYGYRMVSAREWYALFVSNNNPEETRLPLPTPVINYPPEKFGIRGINQLAEWGKSDGNGYFILGQVVSKMIGNELIDKKNPTKYYTDTSFRIAKDAIP